jgi:hypothetical protein
MEQESAAPERAKEAASDAQQKVKDATSDAAETVRGQAEDLRGQARERVRDQVDQRSTQIGEQAGSTAGDLRSVAEQLRQQDKEAPARYADQAADRVEKAGRWLTETDADKLLHDAEDFGRRNPWAVVAGAFAVGFAASRVLKASSSDRYRSSQAGGGGTLSDGEQHAGNGAGAGQLPEAPTVTVSSGSA